MERGGRRWSGCGTSRGPRSQPWRTSALWEAGSRHEHRAGFGKDDGHPLGTAGLQWPCPTPDHPGTPILHVGRTTRGLARFTPVSHQPPAEPPDAEYPLVLKTGRVLEHYHGGTMTRRVTALDWLVPEAVVELHHADAMRAGVTDGAGV